MSGLENGWTGNFRTRRATHDVRPLVTDNCKAAGISTIILAVEHIDAGRRYVCRVVGAAAGIVGYYYRSFKYSHLWEQPEIKEIYRECLMAVSAELLSKWTFSILGAFTDHGDAEWIVWKVAASIYCSLYINYNGCILGENTTNIVRRSNFRRSMGWVVEILSPCSWTQLTQFGILQIADLWNIDKELKLYVSLRR